jgi:hypothetical protein
LASFLGESGEGIFNGGGEPIGYGLKIERKRIMTDKAMSNVKIQNSSEIQNSNFQKRFLDI